MARQHGPQVHQYYNSVRGRVRRLESGDSRGLSFLSVSALLLGPVALTVACQRKATGRVPSSRGGDRQWRSVILVLKRISKRLILGGDADRSRFLSTKGWPCRDMLDQIRIQAEDKVAQKKYLKERLGQTSDLIPKCPLWGMSHGRIISCLQFREMKESYVTRSNGVLLRINHLATSSVLLHKNITLHFTS